MSKTTVVDGGKRKNEININGRRLWRWELAGLGDKGFSTTMYRVNGNYVETFSADGLRTLTCVRVHNNNHDNALNVTNTKSQ